MLARSSAGRLASAALVAGLAAFALVLVAASRPLDGLPERLRPLVRPVSDSLTPLVAQYWPSRHDDGPSTIFAAHAVAVEDAGAKDTARDADVPREASTAAPDGLEATTGGASHRAACPSPFAAPRPPSALTPIDDAACRRVATALTAFDVRICPLPGAATCNSFSVVVNRRNATHCAALDDATPSDRIAADADEAVDIRRTLGPDAFEVRRTLRRCATS